MTPNLASERNYKELLIITSKLKEKFIKTMTGQREIFTQTRDDSDYVHLKVPI